MARQRETACNCYHHGNLRAELLTSSRRRLEESGVEGLSLRALARELGVSQAAPYRHFQDKAALLEALVVQGYGELNMDLEQGLAGDRGEVAQMFLEGGKRYVRFATANPNLFRLMFGGCDLPEHGPNEDNEIHNAAEAAFLGVQQIIELGMAQDVFRAGNARAVAQSAWAVVHGVATLLLDCVDHFWEPGEREALVDNTLRLFQQSLMAVPSTEDGPEAERTAALSG